MIISETISFHSSTSGARPPPEPGLSGLGITMSPVFTRIICSLFPGNWAETSTLKIYPFRRYR